MKKMNENAKEKLKELIDKEAEAVILVVDHGNSKTACAQIGNAKNLLALFAVIVNQLHERCGFDKDLLEFVFELGFKSGEKVKLEKLEQLEQLLKKLFE